MNSPDCNDVQKLLKEAEKYLDSLEFKDHFQAVILAKTMVWTKCLPLQVIDGDTGEAKPLEPLLVTIAMLLIREALRTGMIWQDTEKPASEMWAELLGQSAKEG